MTTRKRYFLLAVCCVIFFSLMPVLVLYVTGQRLDKETGSLAETGIIAVRTEPKDAQVYIDGTAVGKTPYSERFVAQGKRMVEVRLEGYKLWKKEILVENGRVIRLGTSGNPIRLLKNQPEQIYQSKALDFAPALENTQVFILTDETLQLVDTKNRDVIWSVKVPTLARKILVNQTQDTILLLKDTGDLIGFVDAKAKIFKTLEKDISEAKPVAFTEKSLLLLKKQALVSLDLTNGKEKVVKTGVYATATENQWLYLLTQTPSGKTLEIGTPETLKFETVAEKLTQADDDSSILVTEDRRVFILTKRDLFLLNGQNEPIAKQVTKVSVENGKLMIFSPGEVAYFDTKEEKVRPLTKHSLPIDFGVIFKKSDYGIFAKDSKLIITETENSSIRQEYEITTISNPSKILLSKDDKIIYILDKDELKWYNII